MNDKTKAFCYWCGIELSPNKAFCCNCGKDNTISEDAKKKLFQMLF